MFPYVATFGTVAGARREHRHVARLATGGVRTTDEAVQLITRGTCATYEELYRRASAGRPLGTVAVGGEELPEFSRANWSALGAAQGVLTLAEPLTAFRGGACVGAEAADGTQRADRRAWRGGELAG